MQNNHVLPFTASVLQHFDSHSYVSTDSISVFDLTCTRRSIVDLAKRSGLIGVDTRATKRNVLIDVQHSH